MDNIVTVKHKIGRLREREREAERCMQKSGDDRFNASKPKLGTLMSSMASCKPLHLSVNTQRNARHGFLLFLSLLSFDSERGNFGDALYLTFTAA